MSDENIPQNDYPTDFFPSDPEYGKGDKPLVGVVGHGFVGKAVERSFLPEVERFLVDPNYGTNIDQLIEQEPAITFVCTPTPVGGGGRIDAAVTVDAILKLIRRSKSAVVLKSTVTPDVIDKICRAIAPERAECRFVYAPEFLTERNADEEYSNPKYMVLGGVPSSCNQLLEFFHFNTFMRLPKNTEDDGGIHIVTPSEASFVKYAINCFLAMKVTFFNNLYDACKDELYSTNPTVVARTVSAEPRIGASHWRVPGPDGKRGFGGACFPKDMAAFNAYSDKMKIIDAVLEINNAYRKEYDLDSREVEQKITFGKRDIEEIEDKEEDAA
jgi:nucleotide sugar dehydrogenase